MTVINEPRPPRSSAWPNVGRSFWIRLIAVAIFDAFALVAIFSFIANGVWSLVLLMTLCFGLVNWAYLSPRTRASRWLTPGLVMMAIFVVYPVAYTTYVSLTNWQTGNYLTKDQVVDNLERRRIPTTEVGEQGRITIYRNADDDLAVLLIGPTVGPYFDEPRPAFQPADPSPAVDVTDLDIDPADPPATIGDYVRLTTLQATSAAAKLDNAEVDLPDGRVARIETLTTFRIVSGLQRFSYDADSGNLYDAQFDRSCRSGVGVFLCDAVPEAQVSAVARLARNSTIECADGLCDNVPLFALDGSLPGWRQVIGFDNYTSLLTNERIRTPFLRVLAWNVVFAFASVVMTFSLGLSLALALKHESMRGRSIYRSIYILPYAVPAFLSILVWRGLLSSRNGKVNGVLETFGLPAVDWLGKGNSAMVAVLLVNLWLGFPYMFLITSGALTSIPEEFLEAARVDGAGPWKSFRLITLPLLLVSTAPLLIGSFAFNFNNFALIFLLTQGGPPMIGYDVPVGSTDLLISFTFKLAQASGRGSQFGLSSAIVVVIFIVLATTAALSFRLTKRLEDIYDQ